MDTNARAGTSFGAYLFDLDGTLISSIDLIFRAYRHTAGSTYGVAAGFVQRELGTSPAALRGLRRSGSSMHGRDLPQYHLPTTRERDLPRSSTSSGPSPAAARCQVVTSKLRAGAERGQVATGLPVLSRSYPPAK
jgi:hypothetical protein